MERPVRIVVLIVLLLLALLPQAAQAAVTVDRAEVSGTRLRVEGRATANRDITVDGVVMGRSGGDGRFDVQRDPYTPPGDCVVAVSDGSAPVDARLAGCTEAAPPPAPALAGLSLAPSTVTGGSASNGTVTLTAAAPVGGVAVTLTSSHPAATPPASVTVPAGATTAGFVVTTQPVSTLTSAAIAATHAGSTRSATLTLAPPGGTLDALTIAPDLVVGGETSQGTVRLLQAVGTDTVVPLSTTNSAVAAAPAAVTVPAGATTATFAITTSPVTATSFAQISGSAGGVTRSDTITTTIPPTGPGLASVTFVPSVVEGGSPATGTVTLDGPATDGAQVLLTSSDPGIVTVPASVVVSRNATSAAFPVTTAAVGAETLVTITGTACCGAGGTQVGTLTVRPATAPPATDTVAIDKAEWKPGGRGGTLSVRATSTNPAAILTVFHTASDSFMFTLTNLGGGRYEGDMARSGTNPGNITVRSNFGGQASADVRE